MEGAGGHQWSEEDSSHPSFSSGSRSVLPSFLPPSHFSSLPGLAILLEMRYRASGRTTNKNSFPPPSIPHPGSLPPQRMRAGPTRLRRQAATHADCANRSPNFVTLTYIFRSAVVFKGLWIPTASPRPPYNADWDLHWQASRATYNADRSCCRAKRCV